ncbi:hypothetical protein BCIN_16g03400 [Botrytis cinerea B05.10]|uniref:Uncharacterized protein n=1 Tax=Botryotinia fuckeliana (strain B05.10) TaxID=332648 RepID=A0A384K7I2_BOTFB|nr:hypothetical protein BCIN_16g03400 [Botrytis cinerea B05.10]XP_024553906.1 hypothetical protein BCIN_16g03400 [Botrytis cinerea B05.10]ATZ58611.1 hypothetical protein BCIN_16g03400 [Botrytis cinerea B05.10]ATZ58614.1 hypothetical protein BCIN_16g03400 [Botrytis cinerea B05.10]
MEGTQQTTAALIGKLLLFISNSHDFTTINFRLDHQYNHDLDSDQNEFDHTANAARNQHVS